MATLIADNGRGKKRTILRRIQVFTPGGKRRAIRLGDIPLPQARGILRHVDRLAACAVDGSDPPTETRRWLAGIGKSLRDRLVLLGLTGPSSEPQRMLTLSGLVEDYKADPQWATRKPKTQDNKQRSFDLALSYFGGDQLAARITPTRAASFYAAMRLPKDQQGYGLAEATANMAAANLHALWSYAIGDEKLTANPFAKVPRGAVKGNNVHLSLADSLQVLEAMDGTEGKLLFGIARWGGVRIPSEIRRLRWCDVDRERERFQVFSPKTERHQTGRSRWAPLFPELQPLFQARWDEAEEGEEYVFPRLRLSGASTAKNLLRSALRRCGMEPWPRLFHSLRATRQTELTERFPAHVVNAWLGNSAEVAARHYLMVTDQHFEQAVRGEQTIAAGV
jgi:integrase